MRYTLIVSVQQPAKEQTLRLGQSTIYKQPHRLGTNLIARAFLLFEPLGPSMSFLKVRPAYESAEPCRSITWCRFLRRSFQVEELARGFTRGPIFRRVQCASARSTTLLSEPPSFPVELRCVCFLYVTTHIIPPLQQIINSP